MTSDSITELSQALIPCFACMQTVKFTFYNISINDLQLVVSSLQPHFSLCLAQMKLSVRRYIDAADVMGLLPSSRLSSSASRYRTPTVPYLLVLSCTRLAGILSHRPHGRTVRQSVPRPADACTRTSTRGYEYSTSTRGCYEQYRTVQYLPGQQLLIWLRVATTVPGTVQKPMRPEATLQYGTVRTIMRFSGYSVRVPYRLAMLVINRRTFDFLVHLENVANVHTVFVRYKCIIVRYFTETSQQGEEPE